MNEGIRHVALWAPELMRQLLEAARPDLRGAAWVLSPQTGGVHARLEDCSAAARELGVAPGMRLAELRRRFPAVPVVAPDARALGSFRRILSALCEARTPVWELGADGAVLDLSGAIHLFGGDWEAWAVRLRDDLARACGVREVRLVAAPVRGVAEILVRAGAGAMGIDLCEPGSEKDRLEQVSLESVPWLSRKSREALERFGMRSLGDVRRQPRAFLRLHLAADGDRLAALAMGLDPDPAKRARSQSEELVLPRDENDRDILRSGVHQLADRLAFALRERSLGAHEISLRISWSDGQETSSHVRPPLPVEGFLTLREAAWKILEQLDVRRVAVRSLRLSAPRTFTLTGQEDLFAAPEVVRQRLLGSALDRVRRRQGYAAVGNALELAWG